MSPAFGLPTTPIPTLALPTSATTPIPTLALSSSSSSSSSSSPSPSPLSPSPSPSPSPSLPSLSPSPSLSATALPSPYPAAPESSPNEQSLSGPNSNDPTPNPNTLLNVKPHKAHDSAWAELRDAIAESPVKKEQSSPNPSSEKTAHVRYVKENLSIAHFKVLGRLGYGDIGSVYLAQLLREDDEEEEKKKKKNGSGKFAIKAMDKAVVRSREKVQRMAMEVEVLEMVDHPFLPTLYAHLETERFCFLVMDFCAGGDLHALRHRQPRRVFHPDAARFYASEVLVALEYLHMLGIVYRDLKPENVLIREDGHIMLTDFDLSLRCDVKPQLIKTCNPFSSPSPSPSPSQSRLSRSSSSSGNRMRLFRSLSSSSSLSSLSSQSSRLFRSPWLSRRKVRVSGSADHTSRSSSTLAHAPLHDDMIDRMLVQVVAEPTQARSMSFVGTHEYLAPEIISAQGHGSPVDWWTLGIFLYELLFGTTPFKGSTHAETLTNILKEEVKFPKSDDLGHARDLIKRLLIKDPSKRLGSTRGATEIKLHPFFRSVNWALIRCTTPPQVTRSGSMKETNAHSSNNCHHHLLQNNHNGTTTRVFTIHKTVSKAHSHFAYF